jgi:hypothetical protein
MDNYQEQEYYVVASTTNPVNVPIDIDLSVGYTHVVMTSACIPKTYYVLPNDATLTVNQGAGEFDVVMEKGNYNVVNFKSIFKTKIEALSGAFKYEVKFPSNVEVQTSKYTFDVTFNSGVQPTFTVKDTYLGRVMGLVPNVTYSFVGNSLTSANVVNFQSYDEMLILSNVVKNQRGLLQEIFSSGSVYNSSIIWTNNSLPLHAKLLAPTSTQSFTFTLVDNDENLLNLNGSEWSFVLMFFKASNFESVVKKFIAVNILKEENKKLE